MMATTPRVMTIHAHRGAGGKPPVMRGKMPTGRIRVGSEPRFAVADRMRLRFPRRLRPRLGGWTPAGTGS
jgi:hypothetical protein